MSVVDVAVSAVTSNIIGFLAVSAIWDSLDAEYMVVFKFVNFMLLFIDSIFGICLGEITVAAVGLVVDAIIMPVLHSTRSICSSGCKQSAPSH